MSWDGFATAYVLQCNWFLYVNDSPKVIPLPPKKCKEQRRPGLYFSSVLFSWWRKERDSGVHSPGKKRETVRGDILDRGRWEQGG
jgi:hypothetical protein